MSAAIGVEAPVAAAAAKFIRYLETAEAPADLFAPDLFADVTFPRWRLQGTTATDLIAIRHDNHPRSGDVRVERLDPTDRGFVLQLEERWEENGQDWYCREIFRADVQDGRIVELAVYCTGDWDDARQRQHAALVTLVRP